MNFKSWFQEWEGNQFPGDSNAFVNTGDVWPMSKWQGKGKPYYAPTFMHKVEKMYKLKPPLIMKNMNKKD